MGREQQIYIRLRHKLEAKPHQPVFLGDIAQYIVHPDYESKLTQTPVYTITDQDEQLVVLDVMQIIRFIKTHAPELSVESFGPSQAIVEVVRPAKSPTFLLVLFVWVVLFIGSGLAIMNFHEDVSMQAVHQKIYHMLTGKEDPHPLLLQIPYSIGIGAGMIIFFNHVFKKRLNEEPSPLEVEIFNYQQNLDHYIAMNENKEVQKKLDDAP